MNAWDKFLSRGDIVFSVSILAIVFILVLPLPAIIIDALLAIGILFAVLIILTVAQIKDPSEFTVFPTILLFVTIFRLGLNIATTRAILSNGEAGHLIEAFGNFVVADNLIVGLIVFVILTIINFVVITKGSGRVAEVSARFTLDAMPGKQMSIDAELNQGLISEGEARTRRKKLSSEAEFYGSMDGASKFVRGDAIAGIMITAINLVGGFAIGMLMLDMSAADSIKRFALLTVGDGLVTQIPALLISTAAGILVTRSASDRQLGEDVTSQLFSNRRAVLFTGAVLWLLMIVPGFPKIVLFVLGGILIAIAQMIPKEADIQAAKEAEVAKEGQKENTTVGGGTPVKANTPEAALKVETLALELGLNLLPLVHGNIKNLLDRISSLRTALSLELGIVIPPINVRDNPGIGPNEYCLLLRSHEIAKGELFPGQLLAMGVGSIQRPLRGRVTKEPAFGLPATWIADQERRDAERLGYAVVDPLSVLTTHLSETLKSSASELLARQDVQRLIDNMKENQPAVVEEMQHVQLQLGTVHRVMQNLLRERISIREFPVVVEKLCDQIQQTKNIDELSEYCRKALLLEIGRQIEVHENKVAAITLHPELEQILAKGVRQTTQEIALVLDPQLARHIHAELTRGIEEMSQIGVTPAVVCSPIVRLGFRKFFADTFPMLNVFAYNELSPKLHLQSAYTISPLR
jgi:flagellar biosynthesis protein FlhA